MKKVLETFLFIAIIAVLPGGALLAVKKLIQHVKPGLLAGLLALAMLSPGCAHFQTQSGGFQMEGRTGSPETMVIADAQAEAIRAEAQVVLRQAHAVQKCTDDPKHCSALYGYGFGGLDTPAGYTFAGMAAAGGGVMNLPQTNEMAEVMKELGKIKKSLGLTIQVMKTRKGR